MLQSVRVPLVGRYQGAATSIRWMDSGLRDGERLGRIDHSVQTPGPGGSGQLLWCPDIGWVDPNRSRTQIKIWAARRASLATGDPNLKAEIPREWPRELSKRVQRLITWMNTK